jgi:YD repeat-containing protein
MINSGFSCPYVKEKSRLAHTVSLFAIIAFLPGVISLTGCSKDNNNTPSQSFSLPKTYTEDVRSSIVGNSNTTYNLSYDGQARLLSMISTSTPTLKISYQYSGNSFTSDMYNNDVLQIHEMFWLNSASLVDSTFQYNNTQDTTTEKYIYDVNKALIQKTEYEYQQGVGVPVSVTSYTYDNLGNLVSESTNTGSSTQYTYTNVANSNLYQTYFPQPKYLVKTATMSVGGFLETATHSYSFDSNSRLTMDSVYTSGTDLIVVKSYTY